MIQIDWILQPFIIWEMYIIFYFLLISYSLSSIRFFSCWYFFYNLFNNLLVNYLLIFAKVFWFTLPLFKEDC